ncbi:hypothetical protein [Halocatena pleomorpha]|uniref:Uncharacterized protein n=1 Tax=Halocatena pleomorpha TaxID=1785090 RepID=A0A3P3R7P2_9EURY|nr:hypothetical protein [Halocatena pleomorpha]RRJ29456.1 hypothetical protein EIK79_12510 [Halocatena pleomorpha]
MITQQRQRLIYVQISWMLVSILVLAALQSLSLELFFVLSFIGLLVLVELTAPFNVTPAWQRRLKWFILVGFVVFTIIVVRRILAILPSGVF